jgi:hypothetical protein
MKKRRIEKEYMKDGRWARIGRGGWVAFGLIFGIEVWISMKKKVVQIEKENIGSENIFSMGSEDGRQLEEGLTKLRMTAKTQN